MGKLYLDDRRCSPPSCISMVAENRTQSLLDAFPVALQETIDLSAESVPYNQDEDIAGVLAAETAVLNVAMFAW